MANNAIPFTELAEKVLDQLKSMKYMKSTLTVYRRFFNRVHVFLDQHGTDVYTPELGIRFLDETNVKASTFTFYACAIRRLDDFIAEKPYRSHHDNKHEQVSQVFLKLLADYLHKCEDIGNKSATLLSKKRTCETFLFWLERNGCTEISMLDTGMISRALLALGNKDGYAIVRQFLKHLADNSFTVKDFSGIVPRYKRRKALPTTYTPDEIKRVEGAIDTTQGNGKRNLAIVRLATRMGFRSGDIAKLKLTEIDFKTGYINITQEKTQVPISLQMPKDVSDALTMHLENDHLSSDDGYVFHSSVAPYNRITTSIIRHIVKECFVAAQIDTTNKKHGPHVFRSSLASAMINEGASYEVVRKILGHSDPNVINRYAQVDIENLRLCSIDPPVPTGRFSSFLSGREVILHV